MAILGYRHFKVDRNRQELGCVQPRFGAWMPGVNQAECHARHDEMGYRQPLQHTSPHEVCMCGLHGWDSMDKVDKYTLRHGEEYVAAAILGWGTVIEHTLGWRSQYARVIALADREGIAEIAQRYGLPVIQYRYLESFGSELGVTLKDQRLEQYAKPLDPNTRVSLSHRLRITVGNRILDKTTYGDHANGRYTKITYYTDGTRDIETRYCTPACECRSVLGQIRRLLGWNIPPR